jgi:hypothetical protein
MSEENVAVGFASTQFRKTWLGPWRATTVAACTSWPVQGGPDEREGSNEEPDEGAALGRGDHRAVRAVRVAGRVSYGLATGSVSSREIKNNTVRSKDIRNNEVRTRDVRNSSLLAKDFAVGQRPGRSNPDGSCDPGADTNYVSCTSVDLTVPAAGRVLLIADAQWFQQTGTASGRCRFTGEGTSNSQVEPGGSANQGAVGLNEVTTQVAAGTSTFGVECREFSGNTIEFDDYMISAVYVGHS